jgi:hypothetical protein
MGDWKKRLHDRFPKQAAQASDDTAKQDAIAARWLSETVKPAFQAIKAELEQEGRSLIMHVEKLSASLEVVGPSGFEYAYFIQVTVAADQVMPPDRSYWFERRGMQYSEPPLRPDQQQYPASDVTEDEIIQDFLQYYQPKP